MRNERRKEENKMEKRKESEKRNKKKQGNGSNEKRREDDQIYVPHRVDWLSYFHVNILTGNSNRNRRKGVIESNYSN